MRITSGHIHQRITVFVFKFYIYLRIIKIADKQNIFFQNETIVHDKKNVQKHVGEGSF